MENNSTKDILRQIAIGFLVLVALLICYGAIRANINRSKESKACQCACTCSPCECSENTAELPDSTAR